MEIESPWLLEGDGRLLVNGVNVVPLVDAELNRRFPGRALRDAETPEGLFAAWAALERTWQATPCVTSTCSRKPNRRVRSPGPSQV